jgi:bifunctional DNase/RNase
MAYKEAMIDSVRFDIANSQWMTILKRKDSDSYFPLYISATQAGVIMKAVTPGHGFLWIYEKFLIGQDVGEYDLASLMIDEPDGNVRARLMFRKDTTDLEVDCVIDGALALAFRKKARIFADESSFNLPRVSG